MSRTENRERLVGTRCTERELAALTAYARLGDQSLAAGELGISVQALKNLLSSVYCRLDADGAIDAFRRIGWLHPPTDAEIETAAIEARLAAIQERVTALLDDLRTPRSDDVASEQSDGVVAVTAESSPIRRAA